MDKVIVKTLELAHTMMEDDRFLAYRLAAQANDEDEALQKLIGDFNLARMNLNNATNGGKDTDQIQAGIKLLYGQIMANKTMQKYSEAQAVMNAMLQQINAIISGTVDGQIPEEIDLDASCGGDCSGCGGGCQH